MFGRSDFLENQKTVLQETAFFMEKTMIKTVMIVYIILLLICAAFMWNGRNGRFLVYSGADNPHQGRILKYTAIALLLESLLGICIVFVAGRYYNLITLFLSCFTLLIFGLLINHNNDNKN